MEHLHQSFTVQYNYNVFFTSSLFLPENELLNSFLVNLNPAVAVKKILFVIDEGVANAHQHLNTQIKAYFNKYSQTQLVQDILVIPEENR
ncbi:hypothetical protein [Pedobacter sp. P26]|uniref:hypothetical protein n=1 Tax=Pedobacter sp. P26 TaxID=3423956 RepID=UPI003D6678F9